MLFLSSPSGFPNSYLVLVPSSNYGSAENQTPQHFNTISYWIKTFILEILILFHVTETFRLILKRVFFKLKFTADHNLFDIRLKKTP